MNAPEAIHKTTGDTAGGVITLICSILGGGLLLYALFPGATACRIITAGMWLQLVGVATVVLGIRESRKRLHKPSLSDAATTRLTDTLRTASARLSAYVRSLRESIRSAWKRLRGKAVVHPDGGTIQLTGIAVQSSAGHATPLTLESLHAQLAAQGKLIDELSSLLRLETEARQRDHHDLRQLVDDLQTGGVGLSLIGLACLAAGIVMSTKPEWLLRVATLIAH